MSQRSYPAILALLSIVALAGCTGGNNNEQDANPAERSPSQQAPTAPNNEPSSGDASGPTGIPTLVPFDERALFAEGTEYSDSETKDLVGFEEIDAEYQRIVAAWPLPVPEAHPFPEHLTEPPGGNRYVVGYGFREAAMYWQCAAGETALAAHNEDDEPTAAYWVEALRLYLTEIEDTDQSAFVENVLDTATAGEWKNFEQAACTDASAHMP